MRGPEISHKKESTHEDRGDMMTTAEGLGSPSLSTLLEDAIRTKTFKEEVSCQLEVYEDQIQTISAF